ncbi:T9SS type A sorting domain-containing protein [Aequorivita todarodis]|uniref:T9SS type A sorting domain-containing protein n=1 Tax=Aequorivita todarodis TaxID=2036821 RepID=UPI00234FE79C|nr:T9SS type A sorting domain-containing protein [Aequorivita todarodis]MDC8001614.1 T9SS type A sorting domain-containing protein [Aequorivita todarodis]
MRANTFIFLLFISFSLIAQDGQLDPTFTPPAILDSFIETIAQQTDGKILIGGDFTDYQYLKRLNTDGSLDTSFSAPATFYALMYSIVIQPDGKILTGGVGPKDLVRLNADGSMDVSFDAGDGIPFGRVAKIFLQDDGKIIIGGDFDEFSGTIISGMARLNTDGSLDTSFNLNLAPETNIRDFDVQTDGKVIIAGYDPSSFFFKRYNTDNTEDLSFNGGNPKANDEIYGIDIVENDKIMITGPFSTYNGVLRYQMARLNSDGTLDTSFDSYNFPENGFNYTIFDSKQLTDGQYLINGYFNFYNELPSKYIAKINNDGTIDQTFNMGDGADSYIDSTYMQQDGKILIGGDFTSFNGTPINHMARLNNELLGINNTENSGIIRLYPNPVIDILKIEMNNTYQRTSLNIYTITGQLVKTASISKNGTVDCSELQSGLYLVKISDGTKVFNTKLIKQ